MAIFFKTNSPSQLLATYKRAIDAGHVDTWSYDPDGDFTHSVPQWKNKAWLRPRINDESTLALYVLAPKDAAITTEIYAVYHGRFLESVLAHCDTLFDEARATALPVEGDVL